jgi:hypothetical protein
VSAVDLVRQQIEIVEHGLHLVLAAVKTDLVPAAWYGS